MLEGMVLLHIGEGVIVVAIIGIALFLVVFNIKRRKLKEKLDQEYGEEKQY